MRKYHYPLCLSSRPVCHNRINRSRRPLGQVRIHHLPVDCLSSRRSISAQSTGNVPMVSYMKLSRYIRGSREHSLYVQELLQGTILSTARHFRIGCPPIIQYKYGVRFRVFYKLFFIIFFSRRSPLWMLSWTVLTEVPSIFAMSDCFMPRM